MVYSNIFKQGGRILMIAFAFLFIVGPGSAQSDQAQDSPVPSRIWVVQLADGADAGAVAAAVGMEYLSPVGSLPGYHLFRLADRNKRPADGTAALASAPQVISYMRQVGYPVAFTDLTPNDPDFPNAWHLENTGQDSHGLGPGIPDQDIDVQDAWDADDNPGTAGYTGAGVVVAAIDDGIEHTHPDLSHNYRADIDYDYTDFDDDGAAVGSWGDAHGTSVSGIIGAAFDNGKCSTGIAYNADLVSLRLLGSTGFSGGLVGYDGATASAFSHRLDHIEVFNNSWGWIPILSFNNELPLAGKALEIAATTGRGGRGAIHVFAAGNNSTRSTNHDPNASSRYTIVVGGSNNFGKVVWYSTRGPGVFVSAPTMGGAYGGYDNGIYTTDMMGMYGYNANTDTLVAGGDPDCTSDFGGTSAAAPMVSGVVALMLEANPNLTWRDVKHILAETSDQIDASASGLEGYQTNGAGVAFSHAYGFGRINAGAAVAAAAGWTNVPPETTVEGEIVTVDQPIPNGSGVGLTSTYNVETADLPAGFVVEHIVVRVNIPHNAPGELNAMLTSPSGVTSQLLRDIGTYSMAGMVNDFPLLTVANWGEDVADLDGTWTFKVVDRYSSNSGSLEDWQLVFYGYIDSTLNPATGLVAVPASETSITLNWVDNATSETGFRVERTTDPNTTWTEVDTMPANITTFTDTGLTACTRYFYRVIAVQGGTDATPSNTANARPRGTDGCGTTTLTLLRPGPNASFVIEPEVAFTNPGNLSQFQVFVFTYSGEQRFVLKVTEDEMANYCTASVCSVNLASLDPALILKNGGYAVQVRVRFTDNSKGKSSKHPFYIASPGVPALLTPPDFTILEDLADISVLEWTHLDAATGYIVKMVQSHGGQVFRTKLKAQEIATSCAAGKCSLSVPAALQSKLKNRQYYLWRVIARGVRGQTPSNYSNFFTSFLLPPAQIEPAFFQDYTDKSQVRFVWDHVDDAVEYVLRVRRNTVQGWKPVMTVKIKGDTTPNLDTICDDVTGQCTYNPTDNQRKKFRSGFYYSWTIQVRDPDFKALSNPVMFLMLSPGGGGTPTPMNRTPVPNAVVSSTPLFGWAVGTEVQQHTLTVSGGDTFVVRTFDHADICTTTPGLEAIFSCSVNFNSLPGTGETEMLPKGEYQWFVTTTYEGKQYTSFATTFTVEADAPLSLPFRAP